MIKTIRKPFMLLIFYKLGMHPKKLHGMHTPLVRYSSHFFFAGHLPMCLAGFLKYITDHIPSFQPLLGQIFHAERKRHSFLLQLEHLFAKLVMRHVLVRNNFSVRTYKDKGNSTTEPCFILSISW